MKKALLITLAGLLLLAPVAQAQQARADTQRSPSQQTLIKPHGAKPQSPALQKKIVPKWKKGQRVSDWKRQQSLREYKRYGLKAPGRDQRWIKLDGQYLLISIASGLVVGATMAR